MNKRNTVKIILIITIILTSSLPVTEVLANSNQNNEETTDPQQGISLQYDNNGNLLNDDKNNYTYDINNRLIEVENSESNRTTTFTYGPLGNRVATTYDNNTTHHIYDGTNIIQDRYNDGSILLHEFVPNLAMVNHLDIENPITFYYLQDVLGSTLTLTDSQGNIVEQYAYEPYGETIITDDQDNLFNDSAYGNTIMWTRQRYDSNHDLYLFPARTYSSDIGRWLQQDPLDYIDGMNLYEYVSSSPTNSIDKLGLAGEKWDIIYSHDEELLLNGEEKKLEAVKKARFFPLYFTYTDTALDTTEAVTGRDLLTGEKLPWWLVGVTVFAIFVPFASGKMFRHGAKQLGNINPKRADQLANELSINRYVELKPGDISTETLQALQRKLHLEHEVIRIKYLSNSGNIRFGPRILIQGQARDLGSDYSFLQRIARNYAKKGDDMFRCRGIIHTHGSGLIPSGLNNKLSGDIGVLWHDNQRWSLLTDAAGGGVIKYYYNRHFRVMRSSLDIDAMRALSNQPILHNLPKGSPGRFSPVSYIKDSWAGWYDLWD